MGPYNYRRQREAARVPWKLWASLIAVVAVGISAAALFVHPEWASTARVRSAWRSVATFRSKNLRQAAARGQERVIYPYSIVAGGVHNRAEFEEALKTDPVAAAHYADFNTAKFRVIKLQHPEFAYVSFRVGDNVYWTSHRVELRSGEMLITDGESFGRTRCGNRVSKTPRLPTYLHEPSEKQLNSPVQNKIETEAFTAQNPLLASSAAPRALSFRSGEPIAPGGAGGQTASTAPLGYLPLLSAPVPGTGCPSGEQQVNGKCVASNPNTPQPPAPTPEDNSWILFLTGAGLLGGYGAIRRSRLAARSV